MNRVLLFTVVYPGVETYISDFVESINAQSYRHFDLMIVNDGIDSSYFSFDLGVDSCLIVRDGLSSISKNRAMGLDFAIENGYTILVFCDADDYMYPNRIECSIENLKGYDILVSDFHVVDADRRLVCSNYLQRSIRNNDVIDKEFIKDKNLFGFTNTCMSMKNVKRVFLPETLRVVDWYFFTVLLQDGLRARFLPKSLTEYRQYCGNMVGISSFSLEGFRSAIDIKLMHYSYLKKQYNDYDLMINQMLFLKEQTDDKLKEIIDLNSKRKPYALWWENVKF